MRLFLSFVFDSRRTTCRACFLSSFRRILNAATSHFYLLLGLVNGFVDFLAGIFCWPLLALTASKSDKHCSREKHPLADHFVVRHSVLPLSTIEFIFLSVALTRAAASNRNNSPPGVRVCSLGKALVGLQDLCQFEVVGYSPFRVHPLAWHGLEQHGNRDRIDQPRLDRHVVQPEALQVKIDLLAMHADAGDRAARGRRS